MKTALRVRLTASRPRRAEVPKRPWQRGEHREKKGIIERNVKELISESEHMLYMLSPCTVSLWPVFQHKQKLLKYFSCQEALFLPKHFSCQERLHCSLLALFSSYLMVLTPASLPFFFCLGLALCQCSSDSPKNRNSFVKILEGRGSILQLLINLISRKDLSYPHRNAHTCMKQSPDLHSPLQPAKSSPLVVVSTTQVDECDE